MSHKAKALEGYLTRLDNNKELGSIRDNTQLGKDE